MSGKCGSWPPDPHSVVEPLASYSIEFETSPADHPRGQRHDTSRARSPESRRHNSALPIPMPATP